MQKNAGSEKFSFYLVSHIDIVKTDKNSFLGQFLDFEASVWPDTSYFESTEQYQGVHKCIIYVFSRFDGRQYAK